MTHAAPASRGARFIDAFNAIEGHFRSRFHGKGHDSFSSLLRQAQSSMHLTSAQVAALEAHRDLRNAISHRRYFNGKPIAEPVEDVVRDLERLRDQILNPPTAVAVLRQQTVHRVDAHDSMDDVLRLVKNFDFSQIPVYENGQYRGLLTTNAIARWLSARMTENEGLVEREPLLRVMEHAEPHEIALFINREATLMDCLFKLSNGGPGGRPVSALIITESGNPNQSPLALVVAEDAIRFREVLS